MTYSLVLPFHGNLRSIEKTVARARREGPERGVVETLLCHNGTPLSAEDQAAVDALTGPDVRFFHTDRKGIGAGYRLGIGEARADYVILSADDLPFGWTDLEAFERAGRPDFAIGSKAHRDSKLPNMRLKRRAASAVFHALRVALLGRGTPGDSQGSLIVRTKTAQALLPEMVYDHYLASLELATLHIVRGGRVVEVPVVLENNNAHTSSVSVVRDGLRMARELVELRQRVRATSPRS